MILGDLRNGMNLFLKTETDHKSLAGRIKTILRQILNFSPFVHCSAAGLVLFLPETKGVSPPSTVEEGGEVQQGGGAAQHVQDQQEGSPWPTHQTVRVGGHVVKFDQGGLDL